MNESFGSYLKQLRKNKGLSLHDVYEETGITDSRLSKLERNQVTVECSLVQLNFVMPKSC